MGVSIGESDCKKKEKIYGERMTDSVKPCMKYQPLD